MNFFFCHNCIEVYFTPHKVHFTCKIQWILANPLNFVTITINQFVTFSPIRSLMLIYSQSQFPPPIPGSHFSAFIEHINGILQYMVSCVWLFSLSIMFLTFIHIAAWISHKFLFIGESPRLGCEWETVFCLFL